MVRRVLEVEHSELSPDELNANKGTERGHGMVRKSLTKFGAGRSIVLDRNNQAIAGNKTLEAAVELGIPVTVVETHGDELIAVKRLDLFLGSEDGKARELAIADNRTSEVGVEWDLAVLETLQDQGVSVDEWFFNNELEGIDIRSSGRGQTRALTHVNEELSVDDELIDLDDENSIKPGDSFRLGHHRLTVGLSTQKGDAAVMIAAWEKFTGHKAMRITTFDEFMDTD